MNDDEIEIILDRKTYSWNGTGWYDNCTFLVPPAEITDRLNVLIESRLAEADELLTDPGQLVREATKAKNAKQYRRSERLARRALLINSQNAAAATVLSSTLRAIGAPDQALAITESFRHASSPPLLTTRAAALCDLRRYDEALPTVRRALAASSNPGNEAFQVYNRIRAEAPELF